MLKRENVVINVLKCLNDEINRLSRIVFELSEITYTDYKKNIKQTWSLEKCREKITSDYPLLYCHLNNGYGIDFIMGFSEFKFVKDVKKRFSKMGFLCYNKNVLMNKDLRRELYSGLIRKVKADAVEGGLIFFESPVGSEKFKSFSIKYGGFEPCTDYDTVSALLKRFNIHHKGEPKKTATLLFGERLEELIYETYYKPHSMFVLKN